MALRILEIIPTLDRNGAEKQLTLLASGLPRDRFDVHVCALSRAGPLCEPLEAAGVPVTTIGKAWKLDPAAYYRLRRHLVKVRPDIVHTWIFAANCYGRQAAFSAGVKHVLAGERCVDPWKRWHELAIDRHFAKRTDRIVTNSSGVRDFYVGKGLPAHKFVIIPNGISPVPVSEPQDSGSLIQQLGLNREARLIGAVGRLWPQKRYKDLIYALELLQNVHDAHLVIIGDGPQRWRLDRYTWQLQLEGRVHFLGERQDVPRLLPQFDLFWNGSGYEGQSNAIMEAMLAGRPVVASDIPGNRDLVIPDQTGFLVPVGDRAAFSRRAHLLLTDRSLAENLGTAGRQRMLSDSVEKMVQRHADLYESLAAEG